MELGTVHLLSSYAAVNYPEYAYDYARLGILMFGVKSSAADYLREDLQPMPVMTLKARITSVREIGPGETVSYGRIFRGGAAHQGGLRLHRLRRRHPPLPQRRKAAGHRPGTVRPGHRPDLYGPADAGRHRH